LVRSLELAQDQNTEELYCIGESIATLQINTSYPRMCIAYGEVLELQLQYFPVSNAHSRVTPARKARLDKNKGIRLIFIEMVYSSREFPLNRILL
jgi:hypothetical protein